MALYGKQIDHSIFKFCESTNIEFEQIYDVLTGKFAGRIFRNVVPQTVGEEILRNFWNSKGLKQRDDGVPGYYLGTGLHAHLQV